MPSKHENLTRKPDIREMATNNYYFRQQSA